MVATRTRRANAGSRLKHLIEIEELASESWNFALTEDDENMELLFQEDDNDEEFNDEEDKGEEEGEEEGGEEEEQHEKTGEEGKANAATPSSDSNEEKGFLTPGQEASETETEQNFNDDEMLSDSDLSVSESDDSEGERELEKQERANKRIKKGTSFVPVIKKLKPEVARPASKPVIKHSELLLMSDRRSSSRKSALKNKEQLINRIKQDESRRAKLTPVVRVKERKLTQEERLAQAVETERENIESLQLFMEQEIVKKERQKWLLQLKRPKLRNVVRFISEETFVCPLDEVEDDRHIQDLYERRRKGRRRRYDEISSERRPGDVDTELPYYRREMEEKRAREIKQAEERRVLEEARAIKRKRLEEAREARKKALEEERLARKAAKDERLKEYENVDITTQTSGFQNSVMSEEPKSANSVEPEISENSVKADVDLKVEDLEEPSATIEKTLSIEVEPSSEPIVGVKQASSVKSREATVFREGDRPTDTKESILQPSEEKVEEIVVESEQIVMESEEIVVESVETAQPAIQETKSQQPDITTSTEAERKIEESDRESNSAVQQSNTESATVFSEELTAETEKKVTFEIAETQDMEEPPLQEEEGYMESSLNEYFYRSSENGLIYEGPVQHVGRNHVVLMDFDDERWGLTEVKIKTVLFGEDATFTGPKRLRDVETILRSTSRLDNPYATLKEEQKDDLFKPVTKITDEDSMFEVLKRIPRLGDKNIVTQEVYEDISEETTQIRIRTEAPMGLYLPNGNKKLCFISGKEVRYFDPITGVPYENKEMYKVIKDVEMGLYSWHNIGRDVNAYGSAQVYLNKREGARHAKGVPEGFDG